MGCDIHAGFHKRVKDDEGKESWEFIKDHKYEANRHYLMFGWLANVRNGSGFAGCDTGDVMRPLAMPRGLPDDVIKAVEPTVEYQWEDPQWEEYYRCGGTDYGDHSFSWLTSTEIIEGSKQFSPYNRRGVIGMAEYKAWDKKTPLESWSGGIWGKGHVTLDQAQVTHAIMRAQTYGDALREEIALGYKKTQRKTRFVKKMVSPDHRGIWSRFDDIFTSTPRSQKVEKVVRVNQSTRRSAAAKHQAKLQRYANRVGQVSVRVQWTLSTEDLYKEFAYFIDEIKRLHEIHGEFRMVFGFDS